MFFGLCELAGLHTSGNGLAVGSSPHDRGRQQFVTHLVRTGVQRAHLVMFISDRDEGSGRSLPIRLLLLCTCATLFTTVYSSYSIWLQLKHYYKPFLQRYVVRILVMYVHIQG